MSASKCFACIQNNVEYIQIEEIQLSYALCGDCLKKKDNHNNKYLSIKDFIIKLEEKIKKEYPNLAKLQQFKQNAEKVQLWENFISPQLEDALQFIRKKNFTQQNFQLLGNYFQKKGKEQEKLATQLLNFLNAIKFELYNPIWSKENNQNELFKKKYFEYLQEIIQKQLFQEIMKEIEKEIENTFQKVPEQYKQIGIYLKNDGSDLKELNKYYGYLNLIDLKDGKGILKNNDILYFGIYSCDVFKYGVKFEKISSEEGYFCFGSFVKDQIEGYGKMIAYKFENQIMYQKYEGEYENGLRNGKGKFIWENQQKIITYVGSWNKNLQHGDGSILDQNGNEKNVQYEQGKLKQDYNQTINQQQFYPQKQYPPTNQFQLQQTQKQISKPPSFPFPLKVQQQQEQEQFNAKFQIDKTQTFDNLKSQNAFQSNPFQSSLQQTIRQPIQTIQTIQQQRSCQFQPIGQQSIEQIQQQFSNKNNFSGKFNTDSRNNNIFQTDQQQIQIPQQSQKICTLQNGNKFSEFQQFQNPLNFPNQLNKQFQPQKNPEVNVRQTIGSISNSQTLNQ